MSYLQMERVTRQNNKKETKLRQLQTYVQCLKSTNDRIEDDSKTYEDIIHNQKEKIDNLKKQIKVLKIKNEDNQMQRQAVQSRYLLVLQKLEGDMQQYKRKYLKLQNKIIPLMDEDTVRLKVLNQVESNHQLQQSNLKNTIHQLKDQLLKYKRQNQIFKYELIHLKMGHEQEVRRIKNDKHQQNMDNNLQYLSYELNKEIQNRLRSSYEQSRKEAAFYKEKYFATEKKYQSKMQQIERDAIIQFEQRKHLR